MSCSLGYDKLVLGLEQDRAGLKPALQARGLEGCSNYFVVDSLTAAQHCLDWVQHEGGNREGSYIILYGLSLHSLAVVSSPTPIPKEWKENPPEVF